MDALAAFDSEIFGNPVSDWGASLAVVVALVVLLGLVRGALGQWLQTRAARTNAAPWQIASLTVARTRGWFLLLVALFVGAQLLEWKPLLLGLFSRAAAVGWLLQVGLWCTGALRAYLDLRRERRLKDDPAEVATIDFTGFVMRAAVWTIVLLTAFDNLGINVSALVAGLGIGGIAVALAAQSVLADLLASLSIVLDRPFVVGDVLGIDDFNGSVEKVGLKTTRMRSQSGEELIFSNTDLLASRIRNYGRMVERRVAFTVGVTYQTPASKLRSIPGTLRSAIEAERDVRFERAHFQGYGDFALLFEAVYHVLSPDFALHMDIRERINLSIFERFSESGIQFAYPTQTLYVANPSVAGDRALHAGTEADDGPRLFGARHP